MSLPTTQSPMPAPQDSGSQFDFVTWFELNRRAFAIGIAVVCVAAVAVLIVRARGRATEAEAARELLALRPPTGPGQQPATMDAQKLLQIGQQFAGTPSGQQARLLGAGQLFADGKFADAQTQFSAFEEAYPDSPFLGVALLGVASALDAQNKAPEAIAAYDRVISLFPSDAAGQQARLAKARLVQGSQPAQALTLLEDVLKNQMAMGYQQLAAAARMRLLALHPELDAPTVATNRVLVTPPANAAAVPAGK